MPKLFELNDDSLQAQLFKSNFIVYPWSSCYKGLQNKIGWFVCSRNPWYDSRISFHRYESELVKFQVENCSKMCNCRAEAYIIPSAKLLYSISLHPSHLKKNSVSLWLRKARQRNVSQLLHKTTASLRLHDRQNACAISKRGNYCNWSARSCVADQPSLAANAWKTSPTTLFAKFSSSRAMIDLHGLLNAKALE